MPIRFAALFLSLAFTVGSYAADMNKVLRLGFPTAETGFDPVAVSDLYSNTILEAIIEPMLGYDYLARPVKLVPLTLSAMPEVSNNGSSYTFKLKKGIVFADDAAFKGAPRELIAQDYAFSIRRLFDPALRSPWLFLLDGKIIGMDDVVAKAKASNKFDYDAPIAGLEVVDKYTLRIHLKQPDYNLLYILAMPTLGALAREVVENYGADISGHPVGTGPYMLKSWTRGHKMILDANPRYRESYFDAVPGTDAVDQQIAARLKGQKLPIIGRVEVTVIDESQPFWLAFLGGELDLSGIPGEFVNQVIPGGKLNPSLAKKGIRHYQSAEPDLTYTYFNMDDAIVGGYSKEKIALRRAISSGYNTQQEILIIRKNQAVQAQSPIAPGVAGYDARFRTDLNNYNPAKAKALLDFFGYKDRDGDGYRELPDGKRLTIEQASVAGGDYRQFDELWKRSMDAIGIKMTFKKAKWPELVKASKLGKLQMWGAAWIADYPDGENYLQLLYGKNEDANVARFKLPAYDRLYEKVKRMPDSPERTELYQQMSKLVLVYAPWKLGVHRIANSVVQPWVSSLKRHPMIHAPWKFLDIDLEKRNAKR
jgi:oligopeptide transport system substrate-binding protein